MEAAAGAAGALVDANVGPAGSGGQAGASFEEPARGSAGAPGSSCNSTDDPDDDFADSNCDGVDGDASRAVFVAPKGDDTAAGNRESPVATLKRAVELATERGHAVFVCNGVYPENVVLSEAVSLFGGYDCQRDWRRVKDWAVVSPEAGVPLRIESVTAPMKIERLAFRAPGALEPSGSSQAAGVIDSPDVTFSRVEFASASGAAGLDGVPGVSAQAVQPVRPGNGEPGQDCDGYSVSSLCRGTPRGGFVQAIQRCTLGGVTRELRAGRGGAGANIWLALNKPAGCCSTAQRRQGATGEAPGYRDDPSVTFRSLSRADFGRTGANGSDGSVAARGFGALEGALYRATNAGGDGSHGEHGYPGRGGRGGASYGYVTNGGFGGYFKVGAGGGQGGLGGCAGGAGTGGGAGGGSIALVLVNSGVRLFVPRFVTADGGLGGHGATGGAGQSGHTAGSPGAARGDAAGESGQPGGDGGRGGHGGPGAGGPSIALLYSGEAPVVRDAVYSLGRPGSGGLSHAGNAAAAHGVTGEVVNWDSLVSEGAGQ